MAEKPKKVALIGLDAAMLKMIEKHIAEGYLPTFKKLIEKGVLAENCLAPFPTITPPNWTAIATGAFDGTTGITDYHYHIPGTHLDNRNIRQDFNSDRVLAEAIWEALDKAGKKCIVLNYPCSWPSKMKSGIMVGGAGFVPGENRDGFPRADGEMTFSGDQLISTGIYPNSFKGEFREAEGWRNIPDLGPDPLEMEVKLPFNDCIERPMDTTWYLLVRQTQSSKKYDRATLSSTKDFNDGFCSLAVGEWSPRIVAKIKKKDGSDQEVYFRCKLIDLSDDAEDFRFLIGAMGETTGRGWSSPPEIARELVSKEGALHLGYGMFMCKLGIIDWDTFAEMADHISIWLADAAVTLIKNHEWDFFCMHSHTPDFVYHVVLSDLESPDEKLRRKAWELHRKTMEGEDRMLARILEALDKDTLLVLVSDHGAVPDGPMIDPHDPMVKAGLTVLKKGAKSAKELDGLEYMLTKVGWSVVEPDYAQSKAIPQRSCYIYVNLKGRDPDGIVDPRDYEAVQQEIIDALYSYIEPKTGKRPVALAITKRDARLLGLHGDRVGDVIYALQPWFGSQHGAMLPTAEHGVGSLKPFLLMAGPGLKKGYRLERTCWLTDVVPTICYLLDFPLPKDVEGAVIYQAFKDPNFKSKEIKRLKEGLARMEAAIDRKNREPWDRHDCA